MRAIPISGLASRTAVDGYRPSYYFVMAGLGPAIHVLAARKDVDARHRAGHDGEIHFSSPVGTFLFSLVSFMPDASAMVSSSAAKSCCRYSSGLDLSVAAPKWPCSTSRAAAVTGIGTSHSRPSASPRSRSLRSSSGVKVVVQSRLTSAGVL